ncbi:MAG: LysR substrate-binding domain-containing protein [Chthoniobacter sp.]|uniref:LysR family transcriptional regulator n=1 Tax=Chthoniobacter sp. TaxID=2510640 RepID=UPI0032A7F51A
MELRHLRYFVAVADEENVTRAAAKLHVAQPAVSRQIRDLEEELGLPLLERTAKSVRLTDAGRVFLQEARAVLARADDAIKTVRAVAGGTSGELNVGYAPSLTVQILPRALRRFQAALPGVKVSLHDLSTEEMLDGLREGRLHVCLGIAPEGGQLRGLKFHELAQYPMGIAVAPGHRFARQRAITLEKAVAEPFIGYSRAGYPEYHTAMTKIFASTGRAPHFAEEHDSVTSLIAAVESGRGIALVPSCMACLAGPRLKILPLKPAIDPVVVGAVCRKTGASPVAQKFVDAAEGEGA